MGLVSRIPSQRAGSQEGDPLLTPSGSLRNRALAEAKAQWREPGIGTTWPHRLHRRGGLLVGDWDFVISNHHRGLDVNLREAFSALERIDEVSNEEGYEFSSDRAKETAARILRQLQARSPRRYEVYPTDQREVAIDIPGGVGRGILILCDSSGGATCFVTLSGDNRRARYSDAARLPDGFLLEALTEL